MKALDSSLYKNRVENPEETVYEIITTEDGLGWGLAIADIRRSKPHIHYKTKEVYAVLEGSVKVTLKGKSRVLEAGESVEIMPGMWHKAETVGKNRARIVAVSLPAWTLEDHQYPTPHPKGKNQMKIKEWFGESIGYRFFGCIYNKFQGPLFDFIESKIPKEFLERNISDLGCGDGTNTLRIKRIFKAKNIVGYDHNDHLLKRAKQKGLKVKKFDLNKDIPKGELATFTFSLHHLCGMEGALEQIKENFNYLFLCEPIKDLYHALFDAGEPLKREGWVKLFDKVLKKYRLYQYKSSLIIFYKR